jgi:SanA protein
MSEAIKPNRKQVARRLLRLAALAGLGFLLPWLIALLLAQFHLYNASDVPPEKVAIVFGAALQEDGTPAPALRDRIATAAELLAAGKVEKLLMSGDNRFVNYNEPEAIKAFAVSLGVPAEAIVLDYAGRRTYDTCYRAKAIFGVDEAILVTQDFHMPRALLTCNALGVKSAGVDAGWRYGQKGQVLVYSYAREIGATWSTLWDVYVAHTLPVLGQPEPIVLWEKYYEGQVTRSEETSMFNKLSLKYVLCCLIVLIGLSACQPGGAPASTSTPLPPASRAQPPVGTPLPAPTKPAPVVETPLPATPTVPAASAGGACGLSPNLVVTVSAQPSGREGWCQIWLPQPGYGLNYPQGWTVRVAGAEGMNLLFNEGMNSGAQRELFIQVTTGDLPLERADEATYGYELYEPEPLVDPDETIVSKSVETIGEHQALVLLSTRDGVSIKRYFLVHAGRFSRPENGIYVFVVKAPEQDAGTGAYQSFLGVIDELVASMRFVG